MRGRSLLRRLYRFTWRYKMTPAGKLMTGVIAMASVGTVTVDAPVYLVCCVMLGLLLAAELCGVMVKPSLSVAAEWPATMTAGETSRVPVRLTNRSSWRPAYDLMLLVPERPGSLHHVNAAEFLPRLGPQQSAGVDVELQPQTRGRLRIEGLDVHSTFPFNLIRIPGGRTGPQTVTVLPSYTPLIRLDLPVDEAAAAGQFVLSGNAGESTEYLGNRDYTPGEPVRRLDFRAWARLGRPVVREYQDEHASRVAVLVDTLTTPPVKDSAARTEAAISLAAAVIDAALYDDFQIGVFATATDVLTLPDTSREQRLDDLLLRLATTVPTRQPVYDAMTPTLLTELEAVSAAVLILTDVDGPRRQLVDALAAEGPPLKVIVVGGDDPPADPEGLPGDEVIFVPACDVTSGRVVAV